MRHSCYRGNNVSKSPTWQLNCDVKVTTNGCPSLGVEGGEGCTTAAYFAGIVDPTIPTLTSPSYTNTLNKEMTGERQF